MKKIITIVLIVVLVAAAVVGFILWKNASAYIGQKAALEIAVKDAAIEPATIVESSVDFEKNQMSAWYDVDIDTHSTDYEYVVDAVSGEILNSSNKPAD